MTAGQEHIRHIGAADARALFNPAYVSCLIARSAYGHGRAFENPLPVPLAFLIAPLVLHSETRGELPAVTAHLSTWVDQRPLLRAELRVRAPRLTSTTRQALRFGVRQDLLILRPDGLEPGSMLTSVRPPESEDGELSWRLAERLGRWLPRAGPPSTVYSMLGLRP